MSGDSTTDGGGATGPSAENDPAEAPGGDWAVLQEAGQMEAEVLRAALETAEIPVTMQSEFVGRLYGLTSQELGAVTLLVPRARLEEARALLADSSPVDFPEGD